MPHTHKRYATLHAIWQAKRDRSELTVGVEVTVTVVGSIPEGSRAFRAAGVGRTGKVPANSTADVGSVVCLMVGMGRAARSRTPLDTTFEGEAARMPLPRAV
jgi:hypothetical protein